MTYYLEHHDICSQNKVPVFLYSLSGLEFAFDDINGLYLLYNLNVVRKGLLCTVKPRDLLQIMMPGLIVPPFLSFSLPHM